MDDIVAVEVILDTGAPRYFLTWGRIQDKIDPRPLESLVLRHARRYSLGGIPTKAKVCPGLAQAAHSPHAPYFYECFFSFCTRPIPFGPEYRQWVLEKAEAMERGEDIAYCGTPG